MGNEVNDEVLANSFKKYPSFFKARVVRDKRTLKSKGFGFVSLTNVDDYIKAMREMKGKYVGNRPITLMKSDWQEKSMFKKNKWLHVIKFNELLNDMVESRRANLSKFALSNIFMFTDVPQALLLRRVARKFDAACLIGFNISAKFELQAEIDHCNYYI